MPWLLLVSVYTACIVVVSLLCLYRPIAEGLRCISTAVTGTALLQAHMRHRLTLTIVTVSYRHYCINFESASSTFHKQDQISLHSCCLIVQLIKR